MSSPFAEGPNPYAATILPPAPAPVVPVGPLQDRMEYMRSYNYIFENPNWLTTVLLLGVVMMAAIIPGVSIILQLLFFGYQFETIDSLLKTQGRQYQAFDFGRIGDYFSRGLWPFLVNLVASFVLIPIIYIGLIIGVLAIGGVASALGDDAGAVVGTVLGGIAFIVFLVVAVLFSFYLMAMTLRSGLAQEFAAGFQFAWIQDFVRKMWVEMFLAGLFLIVTALVLELLGLAALCIGIFFVIPLILLSYAHLLYQLYVVYLSRGGMPVPSKSMMYGPASQPPFAPPPVAMPPGYPPKPPA
jgi:hypothetical protein